MRIQRRRGSAFTLVELLVATALTLFLMAIISEAFGAASKTFNTMRSAGDMQERMRQGAQIIRRDLAAEHFDGPFIGGRQGVRLGEQRMDLPGWAPPQKGYWEIRQFTTSIPEPVQFFLNNGVAMTDGEGLPSTRTDNHILRFTVKLADLPATELFSAELPTTVNTTAGPVALANHPKVNAFPTGQAITYSRWAEVQYFLRPNGEATPATANGPSLPLYSFRRRLRLLASEGLTLPPMADADALLLLARYPDVAMARLGPGPAAGTVILRVLGPEDVPNPNSTPAPYGDPIRMQYAAYSQKLNPAGVMYETGDDILMTDVLSFEVKASWFNNQTTPSFEAIRAGVSPAVRPMFTPVAPGVTINADEPFDDIPIVLPVDPSNPSNPNIGALNPTLVGQRRFDTWYLPPQSDFIDWEKPQGTIGGSLVGFLTQNNFQPPLRINVRAIQIKIRIWDSKSERARQITIVQEM